MESDEAFWEFPDGSVLVRIMGSGTKYVIVGRASGRGADGQPWHSYRTYEIAGNHLSDYPTSLDREFCHMYFVKTGNWNCAFGREVDDDG